MKHFNLTRGFNYYLVSIFILFLCTFFFGLSNSFGEGWRMAWIFGGLAIIMLILFFTILSFKEGISFADVPFFLLSLSLITILEPFYSAIFNQDFPLVFYSSNDNDIATGTGIIIFLYIASFFLGRFAATQAFKISSKHLNGSVTSLFILTFSLLPLIPLFVYGGENIYNNFLVNLTGRQTGYVAFSEGAIGSKNPLLLLLAQIFPVAVVLNFYGAFVARNTSAKKIAHLLAFVILIFFTSSLGGRTWVALIFGTIIFYLYASANTTYMKIKLIKFTGAALVLMIIIMGWQIHNRHAGYGIDDKFNAIFGFNINREVAFVYANFDSNNFIQGDTFIERITMPIPSYLFYVLTNPIPRLFWDLKPIEPSFSVINYARTGNDGLRTGSNVTVSIPGRAYANFGYPGVIEYGIALGFLVGFFMLSLVRPNQSSIVKLFFIFSITLIIVNQRELQAGKFYPIFWFLSVLIIQNFRVIKKG